MSKELIVEVKRLAGKMKSKEIAERLGCHQGTVLKYASKLGISLVKKKPVKRSYYFNEHERDNWLV